MRKKSKLGKEQIFIGHNRTKEERITQRKIVETARCEKSKGNEVITKYPKIKIDDEW